MNMENKNIDQKWFQCPYCGKRILKYGPKAKSEYVYIKCKNCKQEVEIKIV